MAALSPSGGNEQIASAPFFAACFAYAIAPGRSLSWGCTPITTAIFPPWPAKSIDSAPANSSLEDRVDHPLAICGQISPGIPPRLQKLTSAFKQSKSSLLSWVNGVEAMGKRARKGSPAAAPGAAARLYFENTAPAATDPSVFSTVRRSMSDKFIDSILLIGAARTLIHVACFKCQTSSGLTPNSRLLMIDELREVA